MNKPKPKKKTIKKLDIFIRMIILGLSGNPHYADIGEVIRRSYNEDFGENI